MPYMVPVSDGDFFEIRLVGFLHGQTCITVFRYEIEGDGGPDPVDMAPLATEFEDVVWSKLRELMSTEYGGATIYLQKIAPQRYVSYEHIPTNRAGVVSGGSLPTTVAFVFRRKMALAGKTRRGRIFLPAVPVSSEADSLVSTAVFDGLPVSDAKSAMIEQLPSGPPGILATPSLIVPTGATYTNRGNLELIELDRVLRVQRRREVGRGI